MSGTSETEIAKAVMRIAARQSNGTASFKRLWGEIPTEIKLTKDDMAPSLTRPGEEMWQQIVRNIKSHDKSPGNAICEGYLEHVPKVGYKITNAGRRYIAS